MSIPAGKQANERCMRLQEGLQQLLPGIPEEVTWHHIIPKLPWKAFYVLASVSRTWLHRIRTREVYDARVLFHSTETLVIMDHTELDEISPAYTMLGVHSKKDNSVPVCTTIGLYSKKDNSVTDLPPLPYCGDWYQWVCLDGNIYLLTADTRKTNLTGSNKVFVCDVAEQRQWRECASMNEPRTRFGCGVMEGKIYVFGGLSILGDQFLRDPYVDCGSEVYDPKEDQWSLIRPMPSLRYNHRILTVGDELFVLGGLVFFKCKWYGRFVDQIQEPKAVDVYNPVKDEWRVVNQFGMDSTRLLFEARGKLYFLNYSSISVYNAGDRAWTHLHSWPVDSLHGHLEYVLVIDDELLVRSFWWEDDLPFKGSFQSKGFAIGNKEIVWQKLPLQLLDAKDDSSNKLIQL